MNVSLRPLEDRDLDTIYQQVSDPESVRMAAFTAEDQTDRRAFLNRMSRLRADPGVSHRVIDVDGAVAGTIGSFRIDNQLEVTYWVDRAQWGKGIASAATDSSCRDCRTSRVRPSGLGQRWFASSTGEGWFPTRWRQPRLRTRSR
jgi:RimJ/RimL family protein N-acetyltransferase